MKKLFFSFILTAFVAILSAQQISQTYHFSDYKLYEKGDYQLIDLEKCINSAEVGFPMIPWQTVSILLPQNTKVVSVHIEKSRPITPFSSVNLFPMQKNSPISIGNSGLFEKNKAFYQSTAIYPAKDLGNFSTQYFRGYGFAQTAFSPVEYIPKTGQVTIYQDITVTIVYEPSNECRILPSRDAQILKSIQKLAQNTDALSSYSMLPKSDHSYDILIITGSNFTNNFDSLTDLYLKKGMRSEVKSVTDIYSEMVGRDAQEKIRNYIIQEVNESQISHVILGGDIEVVPYRGFYCTVQSSSLYEDDNIPADVYYSALDGTWNDNNNDKWGEIGEDDLLPDISVGRLSFSNANELQKMIHKSVSYQMSPVLGELKKVLLAGEFMYDNPLTYGGDHLDMLIGYKNEHGYETNGIPPTHTIYTLYDRDLPYPWSASDLIDLINQGYPFIDHAGHSNWNYVMRLSNYDIYNENFSSANGLEHNYSVVYSHGCIAGAFDESDCIGEMMTKIDNFAVAVFFNSRYGWFNEGQTEGPSLHINREFCDEMYSQNNTHLGTAHYLSKVATAPFVNAPGQWEEGALRWCFYDCNLLGDPVLQMWTNEATIPTAQFSNYLENGQTELQIQTIAHATIALLIDGQLISKETADENGNAQITFPPITPFVEGNIWISGINILPTAFPLFFNGNMPCTPPSTLTVSPNDEQISFNLSWTNIPNAIQYKIYRNNNLIETTTNNEYVDNNINVNTEYCYAISTVCENETSELSDLTCATYISCETPTLFPATTNEHQIYLSWTASPYFNEYIIYRNNQIIDTVSGTTFIDTPPENGTYCDSNTYCYRIKAICLSTTSDFSNESCATIPSSVLEFSTDNISIFPNPARENIHISVPNVKKPLNLSIFDITGKVLKSFKITDKSMDINVLDLQKGIYLIKIYDNQSIISKKLIIQ